MKAILFEKAETAYVIEKAKPVCQEGEVLLHMKRIGVCGTDIQVFMGRNQFMQFPVIPFHEGLAVAEEVSDTVTHIKQGDLVTIRPILNCETCYSCKKGRMNACEKFNCLGVQSDGLGSEYFSLDAKYVYALPQDADLDQAIFIEPFAVGVHAAGRGEVEGKIVMVIGGGTIGNFTAQACKLLGAKKVCICDISQDKIEIGKKASIDICINTKDMDLQEAVKLAFGEFPDVIIDCVGSPLMLTEILGVAGKTTTVVIVGNYSALAQIDVTKIQRNELDIKGSVTYTEEDFKKAIELVTTFKVYTEGFLTAKFRMDQAQEMMEYSVKSRGTNMKTIMDFE